MPLAQNGIDGVADTVRVGNERVANRSLADVADYRGCNVLVLGIGPGALDLAVGESFRVQFKPELAQISTRQFLRTLHDDPQGGDPVDIFADELRKIVEEIFGLVGGAVSACNADHLVIVLTDWHIARGTILIGPIEDRAEIGTTRDPVREINGITLHETVKAGLGCFASLLFESGTHLGCQLFDAAAQADDDLFANAVLVRRITMTGQLFEQLGQGELRVRSDRLHVGHVLQVRVEINRVEDAKCFFANFRAEARRTAQHLLIQNAAVHPSHEYDVGDLRDIDTGGQQIDGHRNLGQRVVAEGQDQVFDLVDIAGQPLDGFVLHRAVGFAERIAQLLDEDIGVRLRCGED